MFSDINENSSDFRVHEMLVSVSPIEISAALIETLFVQLNFHPSQ